MSNQLDYSQNPPYTKEDEIKIFLHQYQVIVDLYKHHLEIILKVNIFMYAITGSILSFYLSQNNHNGLVKYSLVFPIIINLFFSVFFFYASTKIHWFDKDITYITARFKYLSKPDVMILKYSLILSAALFILVSSGLSLITYYS